MGTETSQKMFVSALLGKIRKHSTLAGVAQLVGRRPTNKRVAGLIPSQGTCLGCGPGTQWGVLERQPHTDVSLPFFFPSSH